MATALQPPKYASSKMANRRERVLEEARALVAEVGYESMTTRQLAERAGVSPATLFNIFGNKENLVVTAVGAHLTGYFETETKLSASIDDFFAMVNTMPTEILRAPEYAKAMVAIFFSPKTHNSVRDTLREISQRQQLPLLKALHAKKQLNRWATPELASDQLTNAFYSDLHDWAIERISDREMKRRLKISALSILKAAIVGPALQDLARIERKLLR